MLLRAMIFLLGISSVFGCYRNIEPSQNLLKDPVLLEESAKRYKTVELFARSILPPDYLTDNAKFYNNFFDLKADGKVMAYAEINNALNIYCKAHGGTMVNRYVPENASDEIKKAYKEQAIFGLHTPMGRTEYIWCLDGNTPLFAMAYAGERSRTASGFRIVEGDYLDQLVNIANENIANAISIESEAVYKFISERKDGLNFWAKVDFLPIGKGGNVTLFAENSSDREIEFAVNNYLIVKQGEISYELAPANAADGFQLILVAKGSSCYLAKARGVLVIPQKSKCVALFYYNSDSSLDNLTMDNITVNFLDTAFEAKSISRLQSGDTALWLKPYLSKMVLEKDNYSFYK